MKKWRLSFLFKCLNMKKLECIATAIVIFIMV